MGLFTEKEVAYLREHRIGRLGTADRSGQPHVVPIGYQFDLDRAVFKIGARELEGRGQQRLYVRHLRANPRVALVVDDVRTEPTWQPRGITIKGTAVLHTEGGEELGPGLGPNWVEIVPDWVASWGIDNHPLRPAEPRRA